MAEDHELAFRADSIGLPSDAKMIAAMLLREALDASASLAPFFGQQGAAAVCGSFFEARRFADHQIAELCEHLADARAQVSSKFFG
jgi:ubiquinone biosynthesis protein UbiJ